jgi:hypothetical protein
MVQEEQGGRSMSIDERLRAMEEKIDGLDRMAGDIYDIAYQIVPAHTRHPACTIWIDERTGSPMSTPTIAWYMQETVVLLSEIRDELRRINK